MIALVLVFAGLASMALVALVLPMLRRGPALPGRARYDSAVYRDQLRELERDAARGLIGAAEVQSARLEIERRLLAAAGAAPEAVGQSRASPVLAAALAVLVAAGAGALYLKLGAPGVPDTEFALRETEPAAPADVADHPDMAKTAAALAAKLRTDPNNREGWRLYARTLASLGNWKGSGDAYHSLIALGGTGADDYAGYGEMLVLGYGGVVTPAAQEAFDLALKVDAANPVARFYLALADAQAGHGRQALDAWVKLAGETADKDMRAAIAQRIAQTARLSGLAVPAMPPAPTADQGAAATMSEAERATMIRNMVAQLAAKLAAEPNDPDGWLRLGRAYTVLAEPDKAVGAYEHAAALRPNDAAALMQAVQALMQAQQPGAPMPPRAIELVRRAARIDPKRPEVLWYLGLAEAEAGESAAAQGHWRDLLEALPADSPDRKMVADAIAAVGKQKAP